MGGLVATVPPPVEFAGQRTGGVDEIPAAGTYAGTLTLERVAYRYEAATDRDVQGEWKLVSATALDGSGDAQATIDADGKIDLRRTGEPKSLFTGRLKLADQDDGFGTTATLTSAEGKTVLYPYSLMNGASRTLTIMPHGTVTKQSATIVSFDRYWFSLDL